MACTWTSSPVVVVPGSGVADAKLATIAAAARPISTTPHRPRTANRPRTPFELRRFYSAPPRMSTAERADPTAEHWRGEQVDALGQAVEPLWEEAEPRERNRKAGVRPHEPAMRPPADERVHLPRRVELCDPAEECAGLARWPYDRVPPAPPQLERQSREGQSPRRRGRATRGIGRRRRRGCTSHLAARKPAENHGKPPVPISAARGIARNQPEVAVLEREVDRRVEGRDTR